MLDGCIVARILEGDIKDYASLKPTCKVDAQPFLSNLSEPEVSSIRQIQEHATATKAHTIEPLDSASRSFMQKDINGCVVSLDVWIQRRAAVKTTTHHTSTTNDLEELHINLNRSPDECVERTLKRLEISTWKKIEKERRTATAATTGNSTLARSRQSSKKHTKASNVKLNSVIYAMKDRWKDEESNGSKIPLSDSSMQISQLIQSLATIHGNDSYALSMSIPRDNTHSAGTEEDGLDEILLDFVLCPPTVTKVKTFDDFQSEVFTTVPLVVKVEVVHATRALCMWFVDNHLVSKDSSTFIPTADHVGKHISVMIIPFRDGHYGNGCEEVYQFKKRVKLLTPMPLVSPLRQDWISSRMNPRENTSVRVLSYNILADSYIGRDDIDEDEDGPSLHCTRHIHMHRSRRMPMILAELLSFDPDIILLQEVDASIYDDLFAPVLESYNYQGYYSNKLSKQKEGCAMFWSLNAFESVSNDKMATFAISDALYREDRTTTTNDRIKQVLNRHHHLRQAFDKIGSVAQIVTLTPRRMSDKGVKVKSEVVVANTHLFYHPKADHIRAIQTYLLCKEIDRYRHQMADPSCPSSTRDLSALHVLPPGDSSLSLPSRKSLPTIFGGDFNSDPKSGSIQLLLRRSVLSDHKDCWKFFDTYKWEGGNEIHDSTFSIKEEVLPPDLDLPSTFPCIRSSYFTMPDFTNFSSSFVDTLDYIFFSEPSEKEPFGFELQACAPMPTAEVIKKAGASSMPNEFMPSDHVSVVSDLMWKMY